VQGHTPSGLLPATPGRISVPDNRPTVFILKMRPDQCRTLRRHTRLRLNLRLQRYQLPRLPGLAPAKPDQRKLIHCYALRFADASPGGLRRRRVEPRPSFRWAPSRLRAKACAMATARRARTFSRGLQVEPAPVNSPMDSGEFAYGLRCRCASP
jgi:hypothetical protein